MSARSNGMAHCYDQLRALAEIGGDIHRDWTDTIRAHREVQVADAGCAPEVWEYHEGIITVLSEHCTCRVHALRA